MYLSSSSLISEGFFSATLSAGFSSAVRISSLQICTHSSQMARPLGPVIKTLVRLLGLPQKEQHNSSLLIFCLLAPQAALFKDTRQQAVSCRREGWFCAFMPRIVLCKSAISLVCAENFPFTAYKTLYRPGRTSALLRRRGSCLCRCRARSRGWSCPCFRRGCGSSCRGSSKYAPPGS